MGGVHGREWLLCVLLTAGCRCSEPVTNVTGVVEIANIGAAPADVDVAIDSPFSTSVERLLLVRGESVEVEVAFAPVAAGRVSTQLTAGALSVEVIGEALEIPACTASSPRYWTRATQVRASPRIRANMRS